MNEGNRLKALGAFLTSRRNRLDPGQFGFTVNKRRRALGLRREEVAQRAGISATWYVRLEQGRDVRASAHTLHLLSKALELTAPEQAYLFQLARPDLDWKQLATEGPAPSENLLSLLNGLAPHPAYIVNRFWQVVAMNDPAKRLLGEFRDLDPWGKHLIARLFLDPSWRALFADWQSVARSAVAQFRLSANPAANDPVAAQMLATLAELDADFRAFWHAHDVSEPPIWRKSVRHPSGVEMEFDFATLRAAGRDGDFFLSVYTPVSAVDRERLATVLETIEV